MSNLIEAGETIEKLARQYEHLSLVAEKLKLLGSLENTEREILARVQSAREKEAQATDALSLRLDELAHTEKETAELRDSASKDAAQVRSAAKDAAELVRASAEQDAAEITRAAQASGDALVSQAKQRVADLSAHYDAMVQAKADLSKKIEDGKAELASVEGKLAAAREAARSLLAG